MERSELHRVKDMHLAMVVEEDLQKRIKQLEQQKVNLLADSDKVIETVKRITSYGLQQFDEDLKECRELLASGVKKVEQVHVQHNGLQVRNMLHHALENLKPNTTLQVPVNVNSNQNHLQVPRSHFGGVPHLEDLPPLTQGPADREVNILEHTSGHVAIWANHEGRLQGVVRECADMRTEKHIMMECFWRTEGGRWDSSPHVVHIGLSTRPDHVFLFPGDKQHLLLWLCQPYTPVPTVHLRLVRPRDGMTVTSRAMDPDSWVPFYDHHEHCVWVIRWEKKQLLRLNYPSLTSQQTESLPSVIVKPLVVVANSNQLAVWDNRSPIDSIHVLDKHTHEVFYTVEFGVCSGLALSEDGHLIASSLLQGLSLWSPTGEQLHSFSAPHLLESSRWLAVYQHGDAGFIEEWADDTCVVYPTDLLLQRLFTNQCSRHKIDAEHLLQCTVPVDALTVSSL